MVTTPSGRYLLINGGSSAIALQEALGRLLPPFERRLDWVIVTRQQEVDVTGLNGLGDREEVGAVMTDEAQAHPVVARMVRDLSSTGTPIVSLRPDARLVLGRNAYLQFLSAGPGSGSLYLANGNSAFLIAGGDQLDGLSQASRDQRLNRVDVVFLTEASEVSAAGARWLASLQPASVVVPDNPGDPASQPSLDFVLVFDEDRILQSSELGTIEFSTDGVSLWSAAERSPVHLP